MEGIKRRRLGAQAWQELFRRHADSGEPISVFCQREGVSTHSFRRWKLRLGERASSATPSERAALPSVQRVISENSMPFVDLGAIRTASASAAAPAAGRIELRLDLGDGLTLHLVRG